jgi:hypothetical protein
LPISVRNSSTLFQSIMAARPPEHPNLDSDLNAVNN